MNFKIFFISLFAMICCNSQKRQIEGGQTTTKGAIVYLKEGETRFVDDVKMNVTFNKLVSDSRCPKGTNCVWQGVGTVEVNLMGTYTRPVTLKLNTNTVPGKSFSKYFEFNGYTVSLESLTPYPGDKSGDAKYVAGLKFEKGTKVHPGDATTMPIEPRVSRAAEDIR